MTFTPTVGSFVYCGEHGWAKWPAIIVATGQRFDRTFYHVKYLGKNINSCAALSFDKLLPFEIALKQICSINREDSEKSYLLMAITDANNQRLNPGDYKDENTHCHCGKPIQAPATID
jgi:hypothetical protein